MDPENYRGCIGGKMREWINVDDQLKKRVYDQVAAMENIPPAAIEKDYWVSLVLNCVFELEGAERIVFKGGTSLSKGWNLIKRFSEDIDLAIDRNAFGFDGRLGSNRRTKLRKLIREYVTDDMTISLSDKLREFGADVALSVWDSKDSDADPSTIQVTIPSVTEQNQYLQPVILIEINARSLFEPHEERAIKPLISSVLPDLGIDIQPIMIPCVLPMRTFLEKVFLLHEEFQLNPVEIRADRLSRHLYDLEAIMDTEHGINALKDADLYTDIVQHRQHLTKISGIDYTNHNPGKINLIPPDGSMNKWEADYRNMQESMIFGDSLPFDQLLLRMRVLMKRINSLKL